jgi:hypothetical protein
MRGPARLGGDALPRLGLGRVGSEDAAAHGALVADVADQGARVHAGDGGDVAVLEPVQPASFGAECILGVDRLAHDRRLGVDTVGLHRLRGDPVVADVRIREGDDLPGEARVGHALLVSGHAGGEDDLPGDGTGRRHEVSLEAGAVLEQDVGGDLRHAALSAKARSR